MASLVGNKNGNKSKTERLQEVQVKQKTATDIAVAEAVAKGNAEYEAAMSGAVKQQEDMVFADNRELNELLTRAAQYGELLDNDRDFKSDAAAIAQAKDIDDTKVITFLRHIDNALTADQRALLPWPGSTKAEAEARKSARNTGSNVLPVLYDKPKASGGRTKVETFYGNMIGHTTLGREAQQRIEELQKEADRAKVEPTKARLPGNIEADMKRAGSRLRNLMSALRTAAQVRLMIEDIKTRCPSVVVEWIREPISDDVEIPANADLTLLNIPEAGEVKTALLNIWTRPANPQLTAQAMAKAKRYPLGTFKRWKVDRAIEIAKANQRNRVTVDDLIESTKSKSPAPQTPAQSAATMEKDARWRQADVVDVKRALEGTLTWLRSDSPLGQEASNKALLQAINASDEMNATSYAIYKVLRPIYETDKSKVDKAEAYWAKAGEKVA